MEEKIKFDIDPEPVERIILKGTLSEKVKRENKFEDHRKHYLTIDELPEELSQGLSEDKRRLYDITYYLRKREEKGERYQVKVKELADSINRSLAFEFEYFDPENEDLENAISRVLDSIKKIIKNLDEDRYQEFHLTREVYGVELKSLFERDTEPGLEEEEIATQEGILKPEKLR